MTIKTPGVQGDLCPKMGFTINYEHKKERGIQSSSLGKKRIKTSPLIAFFSPPYLGLAI